MKPLAARQVHLDFHTSPDIPGIGKSFSKENFQAALKAGHLSSITIFAKGHHGMCYFPTKVGTMHPGLDFDLLGKMIEACHEIGVRCPIYITAGWSADDAMKHPEWRARDIEGNFINRNIDPAAAPDDPRPKGSWEDLCLNDGTYCESIYALTREICDRYPDIDGLFYDIVFVSEACFCEECKKGMLEMGLDPTKPEDGKKYYTKKHCDFMTKCGAILHEKHPDATIFFNSGGADQYHPEYHFGSTHFEMEDLPTDWGGYDKMPTRARFFANTGKDYLGMTGKFHTSWGEFGGFKFGPALKFEAAMMLAYGARISIGDQMHPSGEMDMETYKNIGEAYAYAEKIEPYAFNADMTAKLGLYLSGDTWSDEGATKMLLETQTDFDVVYKDDYSRFDTVLFPDRVVLTDESLEALKAFIARGGKVIFTGKSLIKDGRFQIDAGIHDLGPSEDDIDYLLVGDKVSKGVVTSPFLCYSPAEKIEVVDAEVLAEGLHPYFNRTYAHYCSHKNTPYDRSAPKFAALVKKGNIIYVAHDIFRIYREYGSLYHKRYLYNALSLLYDKKPLEVTMMSAGRVTMTHQKAEKRYVAHLLYASPVKREVTEVIEDIPDLYNIPVTVRVPEAIHKITLVPDNVELPFTKDEDGFHVTVPHLNCHALLAMEY